MKYLMLFEEYNLVPKPKMTMKEIEEYKKKHELTEEEKENLKDVKNKYGLGLETDLANDTKHRRMKITDS
jgi:hypothetical protein